MLSLVLILLPAKASVINEPFVRGQARHKPTHPTCFYSFLRKPPGMQGQGSCIQLRRGRWPPDQPQACDACLV